jgi:hypothetical protein
VLVGGIALLIIGAAVVALTYVVPSLKAQAEAGTADRRKLWVLPALGAVLVVIGLVV